MNSFPWPVVLRRCVYEPSVVAPTDLGISGSLVNCNSLWTKSTCSRSRPAMYLLSSACSPCKGILLDDS